MILIGQYDSSFVRRVGIALRLCGIAFEHRPWSVFGDVEKLRALNPLTRVPTMVLDDGEVLVDSGTMIEHIDMLTGARLWPADAGERRRARTIAALATGLADKTVSLFYEVRLHEMPSRTWMERCRAQMLGTLAALEADRVARPGPWWFGQAMGHADIAVACALRHTTDSHPGLFDEAAHPVLAAHCAAAEALAVFQEISQPFIPPA